MRRKGKKAAGVSHSYSSRCKMEGKEETTNGGNMNREGGEIKQNRIWRTIIKAKERYPECIARRTHTSRLIVNTKKSY